MLHTETVAPATLELLKTLMGDGYLNTFVLVGGTSLSLQLGHRISVDLDLFSVLPFNEAELSSYLVDTYAFELDSISRCTVKGEIQGVQIDCIAHEYPWVEECVVEDDIRLASLADVAAMKLNAVGNGGSGEGALLERKWHILAKRNYANQHI